MTAGEQEHPDRASFGPDPHLDERGVQLTGQQRRVLLVMALVIGLGLLLVVHGLQLVAPGAPADPIGARVVIGGAGAAVVSTGPAGSRRDVELPFVVPQGSEVTTVDAALIGPDLGAGITCTVTDDDGVVVQRVTASGTAAAVRCASWR